MAACFYMKKGRGDPETVLRGLKSLRPVVSMQVRHYPAVQRFHREVVGLMAPSSGDGRR
jgi:hypothetical protein